MRPVAKCHASLLLPVPQRGFKPQNIFQAPSINAREPSSQQKMQFTSARDIFSHYESNQGSIGYDELCSLLNNLSHVIIPFDQTEIAYQNMLFAVRKQLQTNKMPVKLYDLVEAIIKLHIDDEMKDLVRSRVLQGQFSRNAYDVAICLHFYGSSYALSKNEKDLRAYAKVFQDLKYMQVGDLRS